MASNHRPSAKMLKYKRLCEDLCRKELEKAELRRGFRNQAHMLIGIAKANSKTVVLHNRVVDHYNQTATMDNATKMIEEIEKQSADENAKMEAMLKEIEEVRAQNRNVSAQTELLEAELQQKQADIATMPRLIRQNEVLKLEIEYLKIKYANKGVIEVKQESEDPEV